MVSLPKTPSTLQVKDLRCCCGASSAVGSGCLSRQRRSRDGRSSGSVVVRSRSLCRSCRTDGRERGPTTAIGRAPALRQAPQASHARPDLLGLVVAPLVCLATRCPRGPTAHESPTRTWPLPTALPDVLMSPCGEDRFANSGCGSLAWPRLCAVWAARGLEHLVRLRQLALRGRRPSPLPPSK